MEVGWYDYGFRFYDPVLARFHTIDPLTEKNHSQSGFVYAANNPINFIDWLGLDTTVYVIDQNTRPDDNGTAGNTYTAEIYIYDDYTGELAGPYSGSSYPNSKSNTDNSTSYNTVNDGDHSYNNKTGHTPSTGVTEKGLNIVNSKGEKKAPGKTPNGGNKEMTGVNVHEGASDNGNSNSRGSHGCITINPSDSESFFGNFSWGSNGVTGNSTGTISILRGNQTERSNKTTSIKNTAAARQKEYNKMMAKINYLDLKYKQ